MHFRQAFAYSERARTLLRHALESQPDAARQTVSTVLGPRSCHSLVAHIMGAEERWIVQRIGGGAIEPYEQRAAQDVAGLFADWDRIRSGTQAFVDGLSDADLHRPITVSLSDGIARELTLEQILFHMINHETHHRAQIALLLMQNGAEVPDFDYVYLHH